MKHYTVVVDWATQYAPKTLGFEAIYTIIKKSMPRGTYPHKGLCC
jgi:hypothetical protein